MALNIIVLGLAGSGKSSLCGAFSRWIRRNTPNSVSLINLDPGAEHLPYEADFDVRKFYTTQEVMRKQKLGPNGAVIRCMEYMLRDKLKIKKGVSQLDTDFRIVDLPGQMEVFIFHDAVDVLSVFDPPTVGIFLIPAELLNPRGIAVAQLISLATRLRVDFPAINLISKGDKVKNLARIEKMLLTPEDLSEAISKQKIGVEKDLTIGACELVSKISRASRILVTSSKTGRGLDELYGTVHEMLCACGEM
jgi:GTPase SAR1 family protein